MMDKSAIKNYAVEARKKLIEAVKLKAQQLYIFEDSAKTLRPGQENEKLQADGIFLSSEQLQARSRLYSDLLFESIPYKPDIYNRKIEEVACTWFNRLIALRFMEVNEYLPSNIRVLSSIEQGRAEPEVMRDYERLDYVNQRKIAELLADKNRNASEKLYKYILISQCNALSKILPGMFQKENDYTELLLPDALLAKGGIVNDLVNAVHEDNFSIKEQGQIEIIGWLYQYYISEKKDEVFAALKKNVKINKDTIPAATQLFTPEWIVKYMVENSLGRLWLESNPNDELRKEWKYYIDEAEQEPEVAEQLRLLRSQNPVKRPEDIRLIDPCMGSGHILVYAFDALFQIYKSVGYSERDIPNLILQHNIHGLDIDDRACQLAYFALMMKARSYNRRFFRQDSVPQPMVYAMPGRKWFVAGLQKWLGVSMDENERKVCFDDLSYLVGVLGDDNGKTIGSALKIERDIDYDRLRKYICDYATEQISLEDIDFVQQAEHYGLLIDISAVLARKYDIVITNPPYMAPAPSQDGWVKTHYPNSKSDLCVVFIERNFEMLKQSGFLSMITMHSWMFTSSYENFRENLIGTKNIVNMVHLGARAFEEIGGEVVQTTAFVLNRSNIADYLATYVRLTNLNNQQSKENSFLIKENRYIAKKENFEKIAGVPIAYWVSKNIFSAFTNKISFGDIVKFCVGISTANNDRFLRYWFEPQEKDFARPAKSNNEIQRSKKWFPFNNGGGTRRWYGNNFLVINWQDDGSEIKATGRASIRNKDYYFKSGYTWSDISTGRIGMRYYEYGHIFSTAGLGLFGNENIEFVVAFLNSVASTVLLDILCPSLHFNIGDLAKIPFLEAKSYNAQIKKILNENVEISRSDWDSFETSWDFENHPLI